MIKKILKKEKGFTLIELLAVIVILGIIAAIAIPSINGIINKSRDNALQADAQTVLNAAKLYVAENDPTGGVVLADSGANTVSLDDYLDIGTDVNYSVTVTYTDNKYTYTNISVTRDDRTRTFADETKLDNNDDTQADPDAG